MSSIVGTLQVIVGVQAAVIVVLLFERARRSRSERALRASEEWLRFITDCAPVLIWTARPDTKLDYLNRYFVEFFGWPLERILGEGWHGLVHPEDLDQCIQTYMPAVEARQPFLMEYRARHADGQYRWILDSGVPRKDPEGNFAGYIGCCVDITERKEAELRLLESRTALEVCQCEQQQLAGRLIAAQDEERARVARDLHDDVSQQLAGLSIAFSNVRRHLDKAQVGEELHEDLRDLQQRTNTLAQNVRHLSHDLHPTVLRHIGLVAALESYCVELERTHGTIIACRVEGDFASVVPDVALCLYRIAQETLRNVIAHAEAGRADVHLLRAGDTAEITVTDNGRGFEVVRVLERGQGLGLVSIRERARAAGGNVSFDSVPHKGTCVRVRIPAHPPAQPGVRTLAEDSRRELSHS